MSPILLAMAVVGRWPKLQCLPFLGLAHALHEGCEALSEEHPELIESPLSNTEALPFRDAQPPRIFGVPRS